MTSHVVDRGEWSDDRPCHRCGHEVVANAAHYDVFEQMHYVCFHYEFEHVGDPDVPCPAGGCPAAGIELSSLLARTDGVDLAQADDTVVPAILALAAAGFEVGQNSVGFVATARNARFVAGDPVALLGLVKLAECRRPWRASDSEIEDVLSRFPGHSR